MSSANGAPAQLRLTLLGGFRADRADCVALGDWPRRSAKTLTKMLASCQAHALHREQVMEAIWPGADLASALNSLGKTLHAARRALEPELSPRQCSAYLRQTDAMLALDAEHVTVDVDRFERAAQDALRSGARRQLQTAVAAYTGDLLPEDRYADWCAGRREYLSELHIRLLVALSEALIREGACNEATDLLRAALRCDPAREDAHRRLMQLYAEMGIPDQAVRQFQICEDTLRRELGLSPQPETVAAYRDLLAGVEPRHWRVADGLPLEAAEPPAAAQRPFVGRDRVLRRLWDQLTPRATGRPGLVVVTGEAGVGKTRLLEEFAAQAQRNEAVALWGGTGGHANQFACGPIAVALEGYSAGLAYRDRQELARRHPALARFVPSLGAASEPEAYTGDPPDLHLDVMPAIVRLLDDLAAARPVVLVLGDLREADPASIDVIRYLAQLAVRRAWLLMAALREQQAQPGSDLGRMLESMTRERLCLRLELQCLSRHGSDRLVQALLGGSCPDDRLLAEIYTRSRGNPLFIVDLARDLSRGGELAPRPDEGQGAATRARVSPRARAIAATCLSAADEVVRRVLGLAATARGEEISLAELRCGAAAIEPAVADSALFEALDRALALHLLEERTEGYAFRHPLIRAAVYEGMPRHRREQFEAALSARRLALTAGRGGPVTAPR